LQSKLIGACAKQPESTVQVHYMTLALQYINFH